MLYDVFYASNRRTGETKEITDFIRISFEKGHYDEVTNFRDDFCVLELSNDLFLCFPLFFWDIVYYDSDGNQYHNGKCLSTPLTDEERGIGIIDVLNGDGRYDSDGHFISFHNYDD